MNQQYNKNVLAAVAAANRKYEPSRLRRYVLFLWRTTAVIAIAASIVAGIVLSANPIGPCNHSLWQFACAMMLYPGVMACIPFYNVDTWDFQKSLYLVGSAQAVAVCGIYFLGVTIFKRRR